METKECKGCNKVMNLEDYILYKGYSKHYFNKRIWCSEKCRLKNCSKNQARRKKWNMELEHNRKILLANKTINGEIVGINANTRIKMPDIIKNDEIYEIEIIGNDANRKFKNKYNNKTDKKKCLVLSVREDLLLLFDEVYVMDKEGNIRNIT